MPCNNDEITVESVFWIFAKTNNIYLFYLFFEVIFMSVFIIMGKITSESVYLVFVDKMDLAFEIQNFSHYNLEQNSGYFGRYNSICHVISID